jgi:hypothetical protein
MTWELLIIGPAVLAGLTTTYRIGLVRGRKRAMAARLCSCGHARGYHINGKGRCKADRPGRISDDGCQLYDGPEPPPSLEDVLRGLPA